MKNQNNNRKWKNNRIQFPRLIAELMATGAFTHGVINNVAKEMDLTHDDVVEIIDRAQAEWDKIKHKLMLD